MFGHGFDKLVEVLLCGGDTNFKLPKATYFFLTRGLDLQEKANLLLYSTTNSEAQTPTYVLCGGFTVVHPLSVDEHKQTQPGKNTLL